MQGVTTVIMAGGQGARLYPLTKDRAKPSVPFAGRYRLIDIPLSNCIHSGLRQVFILTQFNSASLNRHVSEAYQGGPMSRFFVQILAAEQTFDNRDWYQGTADAVRRNLAHLFSEPSRPDDFVILAGDHFYRMDYAHFVQEHRRRHADVTIGVLPVAREQASRFGIMKADADGWIRDFVEKPQDPAQLDQFETETPLPADGTTTGTHLASMGIYVIRSEVLRQLLENTDDVDFGHHVIPKGIHSHRFLAYPFCGYWEDIGTMRAFYEANLGLLDTVPKFDFYNEAAPIFTKLRHLPNCKVNESRIWSSMLSPGAIIDRSEIRRSVIGVRAVVREGTVIERSLVMGADFYESADSIQENTMSGSSPIGIGRNCLIRGAIIDKNARIGDGVRLLNENGWTEADSEDGSWFIRDGIIVVPKNATIPAGTSL